MNRTQKYVSYRCVSTHTPLGILSDRVTNNIHSKAKSISYKCYNVNFNLLSHSFNQMLYIMPRMFEIVKEKHIFAASLLNKQTKKNVWLYDFGRTYKVNILSGGKFKFSLKMKLNFKKKRDTYMNISQNHHYLNEWSRLDKWKSKRVSSTLDFNDWTWNWCEQKKKKHFQKEIQIQ